MSVQETLADILAQLKAISADNTELKAANEEQKESSGAVLARLRDLEKGAPVKEERERRGSGSASGGTAQGTTEVRVVTAKEKSLRLTFGDGECSATALKLFIDHYSLAKSQNERRGVDGWNDPSFLASELRFQLCGEPALWIAQESAMQSEWTKSDVEIIEKLKDRYLGVQSLELNILMFEELKQEDSESLAHYMTRCQGKGLEAFAELNEPRGTQQRIVWKFLSGIRDPAVRSEVIRHKWMKSRTEAKSYEEVLKLAEQAKLDRIATIATGVGGTSKATAKVAAASSGKVRERRTADSQRTPHSSGESTRSSASYNSSKSSAGTQGSDSGNFLCHFCGTKDHYGGWRQCEKRLKTDPNWTPRSKGFQ